MVSLEPGMALSVMAFEPGKVARWDNVDNATAV